MIELTENLDDIENSLDKLEESLYQRETDPYSAAKNIINRYFKFLW